MNIARPVLIITAGVVFFVILAVALALTTAVFGAPAWKTSALVALLAGFGVFSWADHAGIVRDEPRSANVLLGSNTSDPATPLDMDADDAVTEQRRGLVRGAAETVRELTKFGDTRN
jgi:hypothetical protein